VTQIWNNYSYNEWCSILHNFMHLRSVSPPGLLYLLVKIPEGRGSKGNSSAHLSQETGLPGTEYTMAGMFKRTRDFSTGTYRKMAPWLLLKK